MRCAATPPSHTSQSGLLQRSKWQKRKRCKTLMGFVSRQVMASHGIARDRHKSAGCAMVSNCKGGMRWECNYLLPFSCLHAVPYLVPHSHTHAVSLLKGPCSFRLQPDTCLRLITPVLGTARSLLLSWELQVFIMPGLLRGFSLLLLKERPLTFCRALSG